MARVEQHVMDSLGVNYVLICGVKYVEELKQFRSVGESGCLGV